MGFAEDLGHRNWELAIDSTGLLVGFAGPRSFSCRCGRGSQLTSFFGVFDLGICFSLLFLSVGCGGFGLA